MAVRFLAYSRWGEQLGELPDVQSATHFARINGEDTLTVQTSQVLAKGDRLLWQDGDVWREHVVASSDESHRGYQDGTWTLTNSLQDDLEGDFVDRFVANDVTASYMLGELLKLSTWDAGEVDENLGTASFQLDRTSVYAALLQLAGAYGCEIERKITVGAGGVTKREVGLKKAIGRDLDARFEYAYDVEDVSKRVLNEPVITACYGYGKSTGSSQDGLQNYLKLNVNGKPYVEDLDALTLWGKPDGNGGKRHVFGSYSNTDCETHEQLLAETTDYLNQHKQPQVEYSASIPFAQLKGVRLGDSIQVIDRDFVPEIRIATRVGELQRDLLSGEVSQISFGTIRSVVPEVYARAFRQAATATQVADSLSAALATKVTTLQLQAGQIESGELTIKDGEASAKLTIDAEGNVYVNGKQLAVVPEEGEA